MQLAVVGTGYVGLVAGAGFADFGNDVACVDVDAAKIARLQQGEVPIYEPGLEALIATNARVGRLRFSTDVVAAVRAAEVVFIAVGTPPAPDGSADLSAVFGVAETIGKNLDGFKVVATKSTVPVGTADRIKEIIGGLTTHPFGVASNPEFLKEGDAVNDFMKPDRVIIGSDHQRARDVLRHLYAPFVRTSDRVQLMDARSAELTKYAANALLATRISFMNDLAALAEKLGADIELVRKGVGSDPRIGPKFLFPGPGYGGSCLLGHETVLIRERRVVRLRRLDQLLPEATSPEPAVVRPEGLEVLALPAVGQPPTFLPVAAVTRRPYEGEIYDVRTKMGRRIRCTPDHPFVVVDGTGEQPRTVTADRLTPEDWLPLASGPAANAERGDSEFDLVSLLPVMMIPRRSVIVRLGVDRIREAEVSDALREVLGSGARYWDIRRTGALRLDEALAARISLAGAMLGTCRNGSYVPARIAMTPEFWRVVGLYAAEGWITSDAGSHGSERLRVSWAFHPRNEEHLVHEVASYFEALGTKVSVRSTPTSRHVSVSSRILARFLLRVLDLGQDSYDHGVPDALFGAPPEHQLAFLSGAWEGDGSWSHVANRRGVVWDFGTASRRLADGMLRLLGDLGIVARWKVGRMHNSTVDTHFLAVSGAEQAERLLCFAPVRDHPEIRASIAAQSKRIAPTGWRGGEGTPRVRVIQAGRRPFQGHVYSLEVPGADTFVTTGGLVVHNCFPKDLKALLRTGVDVGHELELVAAAERVNQRQKRVLGEKVLAHFAPQGGLANKTVAVWGLAFKPQTDDIREAPALTLIEQLLEAGATVRAHDPQAMANVRAVFGDRVTFCDGMYGAAEGAHALVLVTEWHEYRRPDFPRLKILLKGGALFDGRNVWDPEELRALGFTYAGIGRR